MSTESTSLFSLARNKLQSVVGGSAKDSCSLHRWVLLKNSIIRSHSPTPSVANVKGEAVPDPTYRHDEDVFEEEEQDAFMFPDPHTVHTEEASTGDESQWLDSLLENLEDDEDEDFKVVNPASVLHLPVSDDDSEPLSPLYSPMSSSDDLVDQSDFYPYLVPYPPLHPPLIPTWYELEASADSIDSAMPATPTLYDNPLPYYDVDDLEDAPVPDAIDDLSDDESDAPSTPSVGSTSISPSNSTLSMPRERPRPPHPHPQVYVETDGPFYYPFELDALPFPHDPAAPPARAFRHSYSDSC